MFSLRSFTGLTLSLLIHGSVAAYILTQKPKVEPPKPKKIDLKMAMFKIPPPKPKVIPAKPVETKPIEKKIENKVTIPAPLTKPVIKKKLKEEKPKPVKKAISKIKPKKIVKAKPRPITKRVAQPKKIAAKQATHKKATPKTPQVRKAQKPAPKKRVAQKPKTQKPVYRKPAPKRVAQKPKAQKPVYRKPAPKRVVQKPKAQKPKTVLNPHLERLYQKGIRQQIEQKKTYPRRAKRMRKQGIVTVAFSINKMGIISNLRIAQSSGVKSLDKAALLAVKNVGKFPPIPAGINKQLLSYSIPIAYHLR